MQMSIIKMQKSTMIACAIAVALFVLSGFGREAFAADKVTVCHKGIKTASVAAAALSAHEAHGDTIGACDTDIAPPPSSEYMAAVVMIRCDAILDGAVLVTSASISPEGIIEGGISPRDDCAAVMAELIDDGYSLRSITSGSAEAGDGSLRLYTDYLFLGKAPEPTPSS